MSRPRGSPTALSRLDSAYGTRPFRLGSVVTGGEATRAELRSCLGAGQLLRVRPGVAATRSALERLAADPRQYHLSQLRAVLLALGRAGWASLESAALVHELPRRLGAAPPRAVHVDVPGLPDAVLPPTETPNDLPAFLPVHLHGTGLATDDRDRIDDIATTSLARTAVELTRSRPLHIALVPADAALRRLALADVPHGADRRAYLSRNPQSITHARAQLSAVTARMRGWPGVVGARAAVAAAEASAESPLESCSRGRVIAWELPRPEVGAAIVGEDGRTYYGDLVWRGLRVIGEADGWSKYEMGGDPMERLRAEKRREDALRRAGWIIVRWTADELRDDPAAVMARIAHALSEARRRLAA